MESIIPQADKSVADEALDVDADIHIKVDIDVATMERMTSSIFEDHILPARDMTQKRLTEAQKAKDKANQALRDLAQKTADSALKGGKVPGSKEFNALVKAYNAANEVRGDKTRYEVHLDEARADADKKVVRGKLLVRDKIAKSNYSNSEYHDEVVTMPVKIPFTPELKEAVKALDAAVKDVEVAVEANQTMTRLLAQKQKVAERAGTNITTGLLAGKKSTRATMLEACNDAIVQTLNPVIKSLPAPVRQTLMLEAPKPKAKSKGKAKSKK
jgi:hypothetical protein